MKSKFFEGQQAAQELKNEPLWIGYEDPSQWGVILGKSLDDIKTMVKEGAAPEAITQEIEYIQGILSVIWEGATGSENLAGIESRSSPAPLKEKKKEQ